jgi:Cof subfamily protein (haloacid dehalogenase superfamily)
MNMNTAKKVNVTMIKCIAIDMDGTLLNKDQKVSEENKKAIQTAQSQGVEVVIATGRSYIEARYALDEAGLSCPVICINGAVVMSENGKNVASNPMDPSAVKKAGEILKSADIYYEIYTSKGTYSFDRDRSVATIIDIFLSANPDLDPLFVSEKANERFELGHVKVIEDYDRLFEEDGIEFYKLLVFSSNFEKLGQAEEELKRISSLTISSSGKENLEVTSRDAQKGIALAKFVEKREISLSETMAIGDNYNDVSMFERVGHAVAMGNAPSEIQKLCHDVTSINDEHGVAKAIWKALKQEETAR